MGLKLIFDEATNESFHGKLRQVMIAATARHVVQFNCTELAQDFKALADGTFTNLQAFDKLVETQRFGATKEEPINLTYRSR